MVILSSLVRNGVKSRHLYQIKDYVTVRQARIKFWGVKPDFNAFENGTPHGRILGPTFFFSPSR